MKVKFKKNDMYLDEIKYFLKCIKNNIKPLQALKKVNIYLKNFYLFLDCLIDIRKSLMLCISIDLSTR